MQVARFGLGVRFDVMDVKAVEQAARHFWEEIFSVLTAGDLSGLNVFGGYLEDPAYGAFANSYLCVFTGGGLKQMRNVFRKLDNDCGINMYLCASQPFIQNNALARIEGLTYYGKVQHDGTVTAGDSELFGLRLNQKHGKQRPVGKGIRFLMAPDMFGNMEPAQVTKRITIAARRYFPGVRILPLPKPHQGANLVDSLIIACDGNAREAAVTGTFGGKGEVRYGVLDGTRGIIQANLTQEAGETENRTTSYGLGELIRRALDEGLEEILIGLDGYSVQDWGMGCLRALGIKLMDAEGKELLSVPEDITTVARLDTELLHPRARKTRFVLLKEQAPQGCDGPEADYVEELLRHAFSAEPAALVPCRAGSGVEMALISALKAEHTPGMAEFFRAAKLDKALKGISLVITAATDIREEDLLPGTFMGELVHACNGQNVPAVALSARPNQSAPLIAHGIGSVLSLPGGWEDADALGTQLDDCAERLFSMIRLGRQIERVSARKCKR